MVTIQFRFFATVSIKVQYVRTVSLSIKGLALRQFWDQSTFGSFAVSLQAVVWHYFINVDLLSTLYLSNVL